MEIDAVHCWPGPAVHDESRLFEAIDKPVNMGELAENP